MPSRQPSKPETGEPSSPPNLKHLISWQRPALRLLCALGSGILLTLAYPPVECPFLALFALVPILLAPRPATFFRRAFLGFLFGYSYASINLFWLNEIGFGAGFLLAIPVACYLMIWYLTSTAIIDAFTESRSDHCPAPGLRGIRSAGRQLAATILIASLWTALEFLRANLFTGFPWNFLGTTQWQAGTLLRIVPYTGVFGISFLLATVNLAIAFRASSFLPDPEEDSPETRYPLPLVFAALCILLALLPGFFQTKPSPDADSKIRILAVQGNIPQCREYTTEQFHESRDIYIDASNEAPALSADLVIWPETAVPAPLGHPDYYSEIKTLQEYTNIPLLLGTIHVPPNGNDVKVFNSAILLDSQARIVDRYDKIHRVPFGEYVPFGRFMPWLVRLIGMGRDLTPGSEFTVFNLPQGARAGVNICFEDAFSYISREFAQRNANLLITITNDAWYARSCGSRQHLIQSVFRAVETGLPLLRSGNNSDTCLILPSGKVVDPLRDPETGSPFYRGKRVYEIPLQKQPQSTFFTRHGNCFAGACTLLTGFTWLFLGLRLYRRKKANQLETAE